MKHEIGEIILGKVTDTKPYALFFIFEDGSKGLLHISEISDSFIRDIEKFGTIGDELKVKIIAIDKNNGFLRLSYKQVPEEERFTTHNEGKRSVPRSTSEGFKPFVERLPVWIEETLKRKEGKKHD